MGRSSQSVKKKYNRKLSKQLLYTKKRELKLNDK